jgi:CheY-like chemotaxis protein
MTCHGVLVVEDDADMRDAVAMALAAHEITAVCVENGAVALAHLQSNPPPCLILLDLWMPVMDGSELRQRLDDDPALANIPIVALTALEQPEFRVDGFLRKPIDVSTLIATVAPFCKTD